MGDGIVVAFRIYGHLHDPEALADLDDASVGDLVGTGWSAQEVDVEVGRHGHLDGADAAEKGCEHGRVDKTHHIRARDGSARASHIVAKGQAYPRGTVFYAFRQ